MKRNKKIVSILSLVLILLVCMVFFLMIKEKQNRNNAVSTIEEQIKNEEAYEIETDYCTLYYPLKWKDNLHVEIDDSKDFIVQFYGNVKEKDEQHLFDIIFSGQGEGQIGTIEKDGETIKIDFKFAEVDVEEWEAEDADVIYAMQEDMNYLIGMLEKEEGFTR